MKKYLQKAIPVLVMTFFLVVSTMTNMLYYLDMTISDALYQKLEGQTREIKIITIDEKTEAAYGKFENWSREKTAQLIELLNDRPAVLALDIMFIGEGDSQTDARLAEASKEAGNVICASNLVYKGRTEMDENGNLVYDSSVIQQIEEPFDALAKVTQSGFVNVCMSEDNVVRYAQLFANKDGERLNSFAYTAYNAYMEAMGLSAVEPETQGGQIGFFYSGKPGDIPHVSLVDVLEGNVPVSEFDDCLVLVGVYAPGFQDAYSPAVTRGQQMYGVEINANIVLALMNGKLAHPVDTYLYVIVSSFVLIIWLLLLEKQGLWAVLLEAVALIGAHLLIGRMLALSGYLIPQVYFPAVIVLAAAGFIVQKYILEKAHRRQTIRTLKKYMAPQIVEKLTRDGNFELRLGGENRQIAVLFVDVRGFTTMSEVMQPVEVVNMLNRYLSVTSKAIFDNEGTLDKFIGDATMAVFNAPFDLDDYLYKAVKTAWDIREGVAALAESYEQQYGHYLNVGVGVNCGPAVVGNIGCDFRMDYTAIGDTVNTAARLESNAKAGQILISQAVYEAVADRIIAEPIGELSLKGKTEKVPVYSVKGLDLHADK